MKAEPPAIRMKFVRIATTDRPTVKERDELRGIVRGRPFRKVCHFNLNDGVEFQVALNPRDFGRVHCCRRTTRRGCRRRRDRKSTRLNSSHSQISYAVFCLKTKTYLNCDMSNRS